MKKRLFTLAAVVMLAVLMLTTAFAKDIVVLFESDVHCAIDGYAKLAALEEQMKNDGNDTLLVSCGDFVQGGTIGAFSKGQYIIDIMNEVKYDVVAPGNHEFDYSVPRLYELAEGLNAKVVSANFVSLETGERIYDAYSIIEADGKKIAFVGITTPESITKATPADFMNENGQYIYDFCGENLYDVVQNAVDEAAKEGADYVIALCHLGTEGVTERWSVQEVIKNTSGIDAFLDGHSHSVIENEEHVNKNGEKVVLSSVGTKLELVGKLTISEDGKFTASHVKTEEITAVDEAVSAKIQAVNNEYKAQGDKVIGKSEVDFKLNDDAGKRLVRVQEVTLGNFIADAYRTVFDTDIAMMNGGGIRADVPKGDITYNTLLSVLPWENTVCVASVSGQTVLDILEMSVSSYPEELGAFQHVSGMKFSFDPTVATPVKFDEKGLFSSIDGERRVKSAEIYNKEKQGYEQLVPEKMYTLSSISYFLKENGDGNTLTSAKDIVVDKDMVDTSVVQEYISEHLGGVIGQDYAQTDGRITVLEETVKEPLFSDVSKTAWYYDSVMKASEKGIMMGVNEREFAPDTALTRAMLVTILYRMENSPSAPQNTFADIQSGAYYENAAAWAKQNGIVKGVTETEFAPNSNVTREQMAAMLLRYAEFKGLMALTMIDNLVSFSDTNSISEYAKTAMNWAVGCNIITGDGQKLSPNSFATRAQSAAMLVRASDVISNIAA